MAEHETKTSDDTARSPEDIATEIMALQALVARIRARITELEALQTRLGAEETTRRVDVPMVVPPVDRTDATEVASPPVEDEIPSRDDPTMRDVRSKTAVDRPPSVPSALERMTKRVLSSSVGGPLVWRVAENDLAPMAAVLDGEGAALAAYLLATVRARLDDPEGAETALRHAWSKTGGHPLIALGLGEHLLRIGEPADAVAYLDLALRAEIGAVRSRGEVERLLAEAQERARCLPTRSEELLVVDEEQIEIVEEVASKREGWGRSLGFAQDSAADPREAIKALEAALADDPGQLDAVESLLHLHEKVGAEDRRRACASLLALVEHPDDARPPWPITQGTGRAPMSKAQAEALLPEPLREAAQLGALLWEHAPTLFRADLRKFGVSAADRLSPLDDSPLAVLWTIARRCLDLPRTAVFVRPGSAEIVVAPTLPPSVVCGSDVRLDSPRERFRVVRAIASTRAEHLLWSALPLDQAWVAFDALRWAFGRADEADTSIVRAASLGKEYRRLLPPRVQRELRERLASAGLADFATVRRLGEIALHRAALIATRDLGGAISVVAADDPELRDADLGSRAALASIIRRSELAADLVRFSLSGPSTFQGTERPRTDATTGKRPARSIRNHA